VVIRRRLILRHTAIMTATCDETMSGGYKLWLMIDDLTNNLRGALENIDEMKKEFKNIELKNNDMKKELKNIDEMKKELKKNTVKIDELLKKLDEQSVKNQINRDKLAKITETIWGNRVRSLPVELETLLSNWSCPRDLKSS
jgi:septal ring factor EnvC (AmiA/AmiB activator)